LGHMKRGGQGFLGHFALALECNGERRLPLGVVGCSTQFRDAPPKRSRNEQKAASARKAKAERESARWGKLVEATSTRLGSAVSPIHVMDREADDYALMAELLANGRRFVIRSESDRRLRDDGETKSPRLRATLKAVEGSLFRTVPLSVRVPQNSTVARIHPARLRREATLHFRAMPVVLRCPDQVTGPEGLLVNVVEIFEPSPPPGEAPIQWLLLTNEPIATEKDIGLIVDFYRARWVIEEFFKALKTGCSYEKRQLESAHALLNTLALLCPVAWRLLLLRGLAREHSELPASRVFEPDEIALLTAISRRVKLAPNPSVEQMLLAIAGLGGHLQNNGPPGWQVIGRGYEKFSAAYVGWRAARAEL
jgi:hypothetical protein